MWLRIRLSASPEFVRRLTGAYGDGRLPPCPQQHEVLVRVVRPHPEPFVGREGPDEHVGRVLQPRLRGCRGALGLLGGCGDRAVGLRELAEAPELGEEAGRVGAG